MRLFASEIAYFPRCLFPGILLHNDRIQGLASLQQPIWKNQENKFEKLNSEKPHW